MEYAIVTCQSLPRPNDKAVTLISLLAYSRHFCRLFFLASNRRDFINTVLTKVLKAHTQSCSTFLSHTYTAALSVVDVSL